MKMNLLSILFLIPVLSIFAISCTGVRPTNLGVKEGRLAPCPASPNCVSSQSRDKEHAIEPFPFTGDVAKAHEELERVLFGMKRALIISETDNYIHAEFTSALFRFVDDVEFLFDEKGSLIHVRSASRMGTSDMGVNRKRVETIRALWTGREK